MCSKTTSLDRFFEDGKNLGVGNRRAKRRMRSPIPQATSQAGLNYGSQFCMPVSEDQAGQLHRTRQKVGYVVCLILARTHANTYYSKYNTKSSF